MKELQSILLEDIEISVPGYLLRRVALNQHMPRVEKLSEHRHEYHQWLLYLRGSGRQKILDREIQVGRGTVLFVESETPHRFRKESEVRPVCLVVDFETSSSPRMPCEGAMSVKGLQEVERLLISIHEETRNEGDRSLAMASLVLQLVVLLLESFQNIEEAVIGPARAQVEQAIKAIGLAVASPGEIASRCGCTLDHLNRRLKDDCGKTVGAILSEIRLRIAMEQLSCSNGTIGKIASDMGMDDQNYFSRWFRKQTGKTPSQWRILHRNSS